MDLGQKIQLSRKKNGMSQEDLANILNVSRQAVQKWESGASQPEINKLVQISNVLDVSLDYLLKDIKEPSKTVENQNNETKDTNTNQVRKLTRSRYKAIKAWLIVGCILSPLSFGGSMIPALGDYALIFLVLYAVTIPTCIIAINVAKKATKKSDLIGWGVTAIILLSVIGGIFMLSAGEKDFVGVSEEVQAKIVEEQKKKQEEAEAAYIKKHYKQPCKREFEKIRVYLKNSKLTKEDKAGYVEFLDKMYYKIDEVKTSDDRESYISNLKQEMAPIYQEARKHNVKVAGIATAIILVVATVITVPIVVTNEKNKQKELTEKYNLLNKYLNRYSETTYFEISDLINELDDYYDLTTQKKKFNNEHFYYVLTDALSKYKGASSNNNIQYYISMISADFKDLGQINTEFYYVKNIVNQISTRTTADDSNGLKNRENILYLYQHCNNTRHWNFKSYVQSIYIDRLVCGAKWVNGDDYVKWSYSNSQGHLYHEIPMPSWYDSSNTYYYSTSTNYSKNTMTFSLKKSNSTTSNEIFRFDDVSYISGNLYASVFNFSNNTTLRFAWDKIS